MKWVRVVLSLILFAGMFWGLQFRHGFIPPLGKFLNPFVGFWQNGTQSDYLSERIDLPGLKDSVTILWDERHVPHIFASNTRDLYLTQGYITARDRLWQMEFQTQYAAGRISEIVGRAALARDRYHRRIGMVYAAEKALQSVEKSPKVMELIRAYTQGVNEYIQSLNRKTLPVEYKILDYRPEPWSPLKCALLLKYMALNLTGFSSDAAMTRTREVFTEPVMKRIYPFFGPFVDPVIPPGTNWDFKASIPEKPEETNGGKNLLNHQDSFHRKNSIPQPFWNGSNNWAVSGKKTESGSPILCNDPHLPLSLPAIWYEIQLVSPETNTYGVSLPGSPFVVIGFNQGIAWGLTNAGSDVLDFYKIKFKDSSHQEYLYDGEWRNAEFRKEKIKVRGGPTVTEKVCYTHYGPVVCFQNEENFPSFIPRGTAMHWTAHQASNEPLALYKLNRAENYRDFLQAIRHFDCPAQNFVYADRDNNIAIWHNGRFPLRWEGQGRYVMDGSQPGNEWKGWIPREEVPHVKNPERGFVSSANQDPTDKNYPYYLGWNYVSFERGARVNELLSSMKDISPEEMIQMQQDVLSLRARKVLLSLLKHLSPYQDEFEAEERDAYELLQAWDYKENAESKAAAVFNSFWSELYNKIWEDDIERESQETEETQSLQWPGSGVTLEFILKRPRSPFVDDRRTEEKESLAHLVKEAFQEAVGNLKKDFGPMREKWAWGRVRGTNIPHLGLLPGFGNKGLFTDGDSHVINAIQKSHGPSWRMVVELGSEIKAWGIYPGGQSGNPGSRYYDNAVKDWVEGEIYELHFLQSHDEKKPEIEGKTVLRGER